MQQKRLTGTGGIPGELKIINEMGHYHIVYSDRAKRNVYLVHAMVFINASGAVSSWVREAEEACRCSLPLLPILIENLSTAHR